MLSDRAETRLTLALLVLWSFADDAAHHLSFAIATDHKLALVTDGFDGGSDFHDRMEERLLRRWWRRGCSHRSVIVHLLIASVAVDDASLLKIVRSHLHSHFISGENVHSVDAHASREVTEQLVIFGLGTQYFHQERRVWIRLYDEPDEFNDILRHRGQLKGKLPKRARKSYRSR